MAEAAAVRGAGRVSDPASPTPSRSREPDAGETAGGAHACSRVVSATATGPGARVLAPGRLRGRPNQGPSSSLPENVTFTFRSADRPLLVCTRGGHGRGLPFVKSGEREVEGILESSHRR